MEDWRCRNARNDASLINQSTQLNSHTALARTSRSQWTEQTPTNQWNDMEPMGRTQTHPGARCTPYATLCRALGLFNVGFILCRRRHQWCMDMSPSTSWFWVQMPPPRTAVGIDCPKCSGRNHK